MPYIDVFRTMFPEGAGYEHDKIERRTELTAAQQPEEPLNADSHLAFMAGALRTCVSYRESRRASRCRFIDLDGVHAGRPRRRLTSVIGYSHEETVAHARLIVPVSGHSVDSVNLKDPHARHLRAVRRRWCAGTASRRAASACRWRRASVTPA